MALIHIKRHCFRRHPRAGRAHCCMRRRAWMLVIRRAAINNATQGKIDRRMMCSNPAGMSHRTMFPDTRMIDARSTAPIADAETAQTLLERLDRTAKTWETPCGDGTMIWRGWGSGPAVLLVHGGAGSWRHWVRNLAALNRGHTRYRAGPARAW